MTDRSLNCGCIVKDDGTIKLCEKHAHDKDNIGGIWIKRTKKGSKKE